MAFPLTVGAKTEGFESPRLLKVVDVDTFIAGRWRPEHCVLLADEVHERLLGAPWGALCGRPNPQWHAPWIERPALEPGFLPGDVIEIVPGRPNIRIAYRRGQRGNVLFATERCNSFCLMCSQPPRQLADDWRVNHNLQLVELIDDDLPNLAITGGEPTLLGDGLLRMVEACASRLPRTRLEILSNGRLFAAPSHLDRVADIGHPDIQWNIPLYADVASVHDYVVQSRGAFEQTCAGLVRLAEAGDRDPDRSAQGIHSASGGDGAFHLPEFHLRATHCANGVGTYRLHPGEPGCALDRSRRLPGRTGRGGGLPCPAGNGRLLLQPAAMHA